MRWLAATFFLAGVQLVSSSAHATTSGWVKGHMTFYENQDAYCPAANNCTGANYVAAQYRTFQPLMDLLIVIVDDSSPPQGATQIGSGLTDVDGNFLIQWTSLTNHAAGRVYFYLRQSEGGFQVILGNGAPAMYFSNIFSLPNGTTQSSPTDLGTIQWSTSLSPNPLLNVYDGAIRTWRYSMYHSTIAFNNFYNVWILAFNTNCASSCAGPLRVDLDTNSLTPYAYSARIAHELGHVLSNLVSQGGTTHSCGNYTYGGDTSGTWTTTSMEYQCAGFEEAYATFVGDVSRFWSNAVTPTSCSFPAKCLAYMETSTGTSCQSGEDRWELTSLRFLWDAFDTTADTAGGITDNIAQSYSSITDNMNNFAVGTNNHNRDEPFPPANDLDGRGVVDYISVYNSAYSVDLNPLRTMNCSPPGD